MEALASRKVTLLTYDTGQSTKARNAGLAVVKLTKDIGEEPKDTSASETRMNIHLRPHQASLLRSTPPQRLSSELHSLSAR